jgi:hypothetical protein
MISIARIAGKRVDPVFNYRVEGKEGVVANATSNNLASEKTCRLDLRGGGVKFNGVSQ